MVQMMEGSMKTMSWSRYHALSWSFTRTRGHLRHGRVKRARRASKVAMVAASTDVLAGRADKAEPGCRGSGFQGVPAQGFLARALRSVITIFRTGVLPGDTDI
jgi:hypothetical protein